MFPTEMKGIKRVKEAEEPTVEAVKVQETPTESKKMREKEITIPADKFKILDKKVPEPQLLTEESPLVDGVLSIPVTKGEDGKSVISLKKVQEALALLTENKLKAEADKQRRAEVLRKVADAEYEANTRELKKLCDSINQITKEEPDDTEEPKPMLKFGKYNDMREESGSIFDFAVNESAVKSVKYTTKTIATFVVMWLTIAGGLTLLGLNTFKSFAPVLTVCISLVLSFLLFFFIYLGDRKKWKTVVNAISFVVTLIFACAVISVVQEIGILLFSQCSFMAATVVTMGLTFVSATIYFLCKSRT